MPFIAASAAAEAPALFDGETGSWHDYGELRAAVAGLAERLRREPRSLVFLLAGNDWASVVALLAAIEAGHAVALIDPALPAGQLAELTDRYRPEMLIGKGTRAGAGSLAEVGLDAWLEMAPRAEAPALAPDPARDLAPDLAVLLSTSGSTGSSKFVRLSRANLERNAAAIIEALRIQSGDRALAHLALHYSYGLSILTSHLGAGASVVLTTESLMSGGIWQLAREQRCTSMPGVPYHYEILRRLGLERLNVPSLVCLTQAGGKAKDQLIRHFHDEMQRRGGRFYVMYGQTEAAPRMTTLPSERLVEKPGSVGPALPGGRLEIVDERGEACPPGTVGEVIYRGPNVMLGYAHGRACLAKGDQLGGRLATGDLGYLDSEGYLHLTGRSSRIAKVYGMRINLDEIEQRAGSGLPLAAIESKERVIVYVERASSPQLEALRQTILDQVQMHPSSLTVEAIDALPLKPNGKVDYQTLQAGQADRVGPRVGPRVGQ
jgi:acyl-CoA synthetase (AMP-forming)/AMP-acid ligase II